jgi:hypothetical protein
MAGSFSSEYLLLKSAATVLKILAAVTPVGV